MALRHAGRVALVTGGAQGIGLCIAKTLAAGGATVVLADINEAAARAAAAEIPKGIGLGVDVTDPASVEEVVARTVAAGGKGRLDYLVANAGVVAGVTPTHLTAVEDFDRIARVNGRGVFLSLKYSIAQMLRNEGTAEPDETGNTFRGACVCMSSTAGNIGFPGISPYVYTKWAVQGLIKTTALEYANCGIRVNGIAPAVVPTPMVEAYAKSQNMTLQEVVGLNPMSGYAKAEDVAEAASFLLSPETARFVSGTILPVDGALLSGRENTTKRLQPFLDMDSE